MSASVLYMSMSVDGYIAGPNETPPQPGRRPVHAWLHQWFGFAADPSPTSPSTDPSGIAQQFLDECRWGPEPSCRVATR